MDDSGAVDALKQAVDKLKADPALLHAPSMDFFRDYLRSLGATLPVQTSSEKAAPSDAKPTEAEESEAAESSVEDEDEADDDVVAEADADVQTPQAAPDMSKEPSEDELSKAAELKGQAMEAAAAGETDKAEALWNEVVVLTPNANVLASRGMCFLAKKKPLAAIRDADYALQVCARVRHARAWECTGAVLGWAGVGTPRPQG